MKRLHNIATCFKLAVRNLIREKTYGIISILGLVIAITCAILVCTRVIDDYRYVTYYENGDRIYRALFRSKTDNSVSINDWTPGGITIDLREQVPEVELAARVNASFYTKDWMRYGDVTLRQFFCRADPEILDILDFEFVSGSLKTSPGTVVVTESVAKRFFKEENPIGKTISEVPGSDYIITGVLKDIPKYAHIRIDFLSASPPSEPDPNWDGWTARLSGPKNYVLLREGTNAEAVEQKLNDIMAKSAPADAIKKGTLHLQPMTRAYLYGSQEFGTLGENKIAYLYKIIALALLVIIVASVNFINLAAARTLARSREIATRKSIGAGKFDIALQFLIESLTVAIFATLIAIALATVLPASDFTRIPFMWSDLQNLQMIIGIASIIFVIGLAAGLYPAFLASRVQPIEGGRTQKSRRIGNFSVRNLLLVIQMGCAIFFIVGTNVVYKQVNHLTNADIGFDQEHMITTRHIFVGENDGKQDMVKQAYNALPGVISATTIWPGPGLGEKPRRTVTKKSDPLTEHTMQVMGIEPDFLKTHRATLLAGRNVGPNFTHRDNAEFILNETALKRLGYDLSAPPDSDTHPLGKSLRVGNYKGTVIGVMKNFHYRSLRHALEPMVLFNWSRIALAMRIKSDDMLGTLASMEETWKQFFPQPPSFIFVDRTFTYGGQERQGRVFAMLAWTAIFLAGLGVFGLAAYETEQRRKEVGIRKVLGATIPSIVTLFWKQHAGLVVAANVIAWPLAYHLMQEWLSSFAYRIDLTAIPFLLAGLAVALLFLCVVGTQATRIGRLNPTDTLRSE